MERSILQLYRTLVNSAIQRVNPAVFRFNIIGIQAADPCQAQSAVALDFSNHGTQSIYMGHG